MANRVITRAHGKDRVIDFRDSLVAAMPDDYATMHQRRLSVLLRHFVIVRYRHLTKTLLADLQPLVAKRRFQVDLDRHTFISSAF